MSGRLDDQRSFWKYFLLTAITCGIYGIIFMWTMINDMNVACGEVEDSDSEKSPNFIVLFLLSTVTCGIYMWFWWYKQGNRLKHCGEIYGARVDETGGTYLLWLIFGSVVCGIGPLYAMHLLIKNVNTVCRGYNDRMDSNMPGGSNWEVQPPVEPYRPTPVVETPPQRFIPDQGANTQPFTMTSISESRSERTVAARKGTIECIKGTYTGASMDILPGQQITIGRSANYAQLIIPDSDISRRHCVIRFDQADGSYYVTDYSSIGTTLNGTIRLPKEVPYRCPIGSRLSLANGNNEFILK